MKESKNDFRDVKLSRKQGLALNLLDNNTDVTEVFYGGAAGGGKSYLGCIWQIRRRLNHPGSRGLIGRNVLKDLKDTTMETFFKVADECFGLKNGVHYSYKEQKGRVVFGNGSFIYLRELKAQPSDPNFSDLGSLEITDAFIDESTEITKKARDILKTRIRHQLIGGVPKMFLTGNPDPGWVKIEYVSDKRGKPVQLKSYQRFVPALVDDNPDKEFVEDYKKLLEELPEYDKQRLLFGNWNIMDNPNPFYPVFFDSGDSIIHNVRREIDPKWEVWLSFDFNHNPCTCIISQLIDGFGLYIYDTVQVIGGTEALCDVLIEDYDIMKYVDGPMGVEITGDDSGWANTSAGRMDYEIVADKFMLNTNSFQRYSKAKKRFKYRFKIIYHLMNKIPIGLNREGNEVLISDLRTALRKDDSSESKFKDRDKGHPQDAGDAFDYKIISMFDGGKRHIDRWKEEYDYLNQ